MKVKIYTKISSEAISTEIDSKTTSDLANFLNDSTNEWLPTINAVIRVNDIVSIEKINE